MITTRPYRQGDGALINVAEPDPWPDWLQEMEQDTRGLTSYLRDGRLVAVTGYQPLWDGVAWGFALVDRQAVKGAGLELAEAVRRVIAELMARDGLHRVQACCDPADPPTKVFLRATGYRYESTMKKASHNGGDLLMMAITTGD